jgi:hypothetical protein
MDGSELTVSGGPSTPADLWYLRTMLCYPAVLLSTFIITAATYSIQSSRSEEELVEPVATGPGGRPLPATKRRKKDPKAKSPLFELYIGVGARRAFQYVTAALVLSFVADCATVLARVFDDRGRDWRCDEERVVRNYPQHPFPSPRFCDADEMPRSTSLEVFSSISMFSSPWFSGPMPRTSLTAWCGCLP